MRWFLDNAKMVECETNKTVITPNALTKIEEHEEYEHNDKIKDENSPKNLNSIDTKNNNDDNECKDSDISKRDSNYNDFDPLKYAIEFFASYNSETNQVCLPLVTSEG